MTLVSALLIYLAVSVLATVLWALFFSRLRSRRWDAIDEELHEMIAAARAADKITNLT